MKLAPVLPFGWGGGEGRGGEGRGGFFLFILIQPFFMPSNEIVSSANTRNGRNNITMNFL